MGVINCDKHGMVGLVEVCEHVHADLINGIYPEMYDFPVFMVRVCKECYDKTKEAKLPDDVELGDLVDLPEVEAEAILENASPLYDALNRVVQCNECIAELELKQARSRGEKDPFKAYDNTLMHEDQPLINKLQNGLLDKFTFQDSQIEYLDSKACFALSGGIYRPLEIIIYYIEDKETQMKILDYIDQFFENISKKQRMVSFYKAENWITEHTGNSRSKKRGEEILLYRKID